MGVTPSLNVTVTRGVGDLSSAVTTESGVFLEGTTLSFWDYAHLTLLALIFVVGLAANGLTLCLLAHSSDLRQVTGPPIVGVAVVNILQAVTLLPERSISIVGGSAWLSEAMCVMFGWMYVAFKVSALCYTACIAVDRCLSVLWPLRYQGHVMRLTTRVSSVCACVYSALLATIALLGWGHYAYSPGKQLCLPYPLSSGYTLLVLVAGMLVPHILTMVAFLVLSYTAWHTAKHANYVCDANHCTLVTNRKSHRKNLRMTLIHIGRSHDMTSQTSNISHTKSQNLNVSRLVLQLFLPNPLKPGFKIENEDVVGVTPTGDANYIWVINNFITN